MKTHAHVWEYLAKYLTELSMFWKLLSREKWKISLLTHFSHKVLRFEIILNESLGYAHILRFLYSALNSEFPNTLEYCWSFLFSITIMRCFLPTYPQVYTCCRSSLFSTVTVDFRRNIGVNKKSCLLTAAMISTLCYCYAKIERPVSTSDLKSWREMQKQHSRNITLLMFIATYFLGSGKA
jgi:hypothetical protein